MEKQILEVIVSLGWGSWQDDPPMEGIGHFEGTEEDCLELKKELESTIAMFTLRKKRK
jgi:hypothetical protein